MVNPDGSFLRNGWSFRPCSRKNLPPSRCSGPKEVSVVVILAGGGTVSGNIYKYYVTYLLIQGEYIQRRELKRTGVGGK